MEGDEDEEHGSLEQLREAVDRLHNLPPDEVLRRAHEALLKTLLAKVELGTISHQEQAILRNMLRDNNMVLAVAPPGTQLPRVEAPTELPSFGEPEYDND